MFRGVLFDWDGTLADTRHSILLSFRRVLNGIGVTVPDEFIARRIGIGADKTFREILQAKNTPFDNVLMQRLVEQKIQAEIDLSDSVKLFSGTIELLTSLKGSVKLALASMNNQLVINHLLAKLGVLHFFDVVVTAEEVSSFKPHPEIFLKCASRLVLCPEECLVVEDSVFGVEAAKAAGMSCLGILTGVYSAEELASAGADMIVSSLADTAKIVGLILR